MPQDNMVFLPPGGTMGELIRSHDWSKTPLGPIEQWPPTLLSNLAMILESPVPLQICWGRELTMLYNDAYIKVLGDKHVALGKRFLDVLLEARETIEPLIEKAFSGESVLFENGPFTLMRQGFLKEAWFDFSFSPIRDDQGVIAGVLNIAIETSERTQAEDAQRLCMKKLLQIFSASPAFLVMTDAQSGRHIEVDETFCQLSGYSREEILGRTCIELGLLDPEFRECRNREILNKGGKRGMELDLRRKTGEIRRIYYSTDITEQDGRQIFVSSGFDITERKQAEDALKQNEALLMALFQNAPISIALLDNDLRFMRLNPAGEELNGLSDDEARGKHIFEVVPKVANKIIPRLRQVLATGKPETVELSGELPGSPGETRHWISSRFPILIDDRPLGVAVMTHEITNRKKAEEALRESEERHRAFFEASMDAVLLTSPDGSILAANPAAIKMFKMTEAEICAAGRNGLVDISDPRLPTLLDERFRSGRVFGELKMKRGDGSTFEAEISSGVYQDATGKSLSSLVIRDITERKRAEEKKDSDAREIRLINSILRVFAEEDGDVVFNRILAVVQKEMRSLHGVVGYVPEPNHLVCPSLSSMLDECEVKGKCIHYPPQKWKGLWAQALKEKKTLWTNSPSRVPAGHVPIDNNLATPILFKNEVIGLINLANKEGGYMEKDAAILDAISERISPLLYIWIQKMQRMEERFKSEEALRNLANELEQRVLERTTDLEHANRAKDQFLANMSHEIRTPMAGVLGLTEILLHQELPTKVQNDLAMVRKSAESVMTLINDLFDLSRISQGKFDFHPEEFDLRSMVRDAIGPFEFQALSKDLDFTISIDESVPSQILCDKERLGQVIKNLVSNAIKFTERGFVRVHVKAEKNDEDTLRLSFSVADSGLGIPKSKQKEVFSAFTQIDPSYSKKFAGMGLGLAISKSLVEGMGGEISVVSTRGKGATFRFFVMCGIVIEEQEPTVPSITLQDIPSMTILLAEDNAVNRLFLRRALVTAGHKVGEAENGRNALEKLADTHFDIILMDIQMPEMDGVEATRLIRSGRHGRADIPIIALTAYAMKGDREKFLDNGMDGYVTKPVDFGELARVIAEVSGK
jgi:PAS domain S-box-containing protein